MELVSEQIMQRARQVDEAPWGTKMEARRQILIDALNTAILSIDATQVQAFKLHTLQFIPKALNMEDL